jgi:hypothetical protein
MLAYALPSSPLSKFAFCDLVLASTLELEKVRAGRPAKSEPLRHLADALSRAASPMSEGVPTAFVEATYFEPLERLFTTFRSRQPNSIKQIQDFVQEASQNMRDHGKEGASKEAVLDLISFCVALHEELVRGLESENGVVIDESRTSDNLAEAVLS